MSRPLSSPDVFTAIADPTRRAILTALSRGDRSVSELARPFDVSLPAVSQHLRVLRQTGLVTQRRQGARRVYRLNAKPLRPVARWLARYERFWTTRLDALDRHLKESSP